MDNPIRNFTRLDAQLAVGSYVSGPEAVAFLASQGIRGVVCLQSDAGLSSLGIRWPALWQLYVQHGITPVRVAMVDFDKRSLLKNLTSAVDAIAELVGGGTCTYIHCRAGLNRSTTSVIAYLMRERGMSLGDAWSWLMDRHEAMPYEGVLQKWAKRNGLQA